MKRFAPGAAALLALAACRGPLQALRLEASVVTETGKFQLEYASSDERDIVELQTVLHATGPKLARWGTLAEPVVVHVLPDHRLLEEAVDRSGYPWLRAWARYDEVFLQAPHTWSLFGASQRELDELLLHELTHCVMYQAAGSRSTWAEKEIPLWFREGLATVTAAQGYRWPSLEDLARYYEAHPGADPLAAPEALYRTQSEVVYGAAHHAMTFLLRRYGDDRVKAVLAELKAGRDFPAAFEQAIGVRASAFVAEVERYVKMRGFRGGRVRRSGVAAPLPPGAPESPVPGEGASGQPQG